jgi:spore germination cell wall hydrolase CwlJ-like protein
MFKFKSVAKYACATIFFTAASIMAAPSLAEAGRPIADRASAGAENTNISVLTLDSTETSPNAAQQSADLFSESLNNNVATTSLSDLVRQLSTTETADAEQECLAGAVYFESKGEPLEGQHAVAEVVINRTKSGRFPTSLCSVVYQRGQFSFVRGNAMPSIQRSSTAWRQAVTIARIAMENRWKNVVPNALFFHARRLAPGWRHDKIAAVGNHVFYR